MKLCLSGAVAGAAFCATLMSAAVQAATYDIGSMNIVSGGYKVWGSDGVQIINPDTNGPIFPYTVPGPDTNLVGGYIGNGGAGLPNTTPDPNGIVASNWFGAPVNIYSAATNTGDLASPAGSIVGGPVPSGILDDVANSITMNLDSLFGNWADTDFSIGTGKNDGFTSAFAAGAWDPVSGAYSLSWFTRVANTVGGPCWPDGCTAEFTFEGTASAVPLPAARWLFGGGLLGMIGLAGRK